MATAIPHSMLKLPAEPEEESCDFVQNPQSKSTVQNSIVSKRTFVFQTVLVATKKDFETKNRKKFCARIATGEYDAVIIGHSQFERIPVSLERQERLLNEQIEEITNGIAEVKFSGGENITEFFPPQDSWFS